MLRDTFFTLLMLALVPVCFRRPLVGMLTFSWLAYMRPQDLTWGFARDQRWSFLIAGITLAGWLFQSRRRFILINARAWAMIGLIVLVGLGVLTSRRIFAWQVDRYVEFVKIIGVALFTTAVVTRAEHLRVLLWVIALSFGFYGVKIGLFGILSGGQQVLQGPGGMLADNNDLSLALCMGLPFLVQIGASEKNKVLRRWFFVMVPLQILAIVLTYSRGGFLALAALLFILVWRSRNRLTALSLLAVTGVLALLVVPQSFIERVASIGDYQQDTSAMGRLAAWRLAGRMILNHPLLGVGLTRFAFEARFHVVAGEERGAPVAHNAYLQIWAECGTPVFLLYLFLIGATFWSLWKLRTEARRIYEQSWIHNYCSMFEASLVAFVVGSLFLNRAHFDLFYHFVAIVMAFEVIAWQELRAARQAPERASARRAVELRHPRGFERPPRRSGFRDGTALEGTA